ncbi:type II toxin-antitoxin system RelE/ParE family toxin [Nitriliruptoria bacterium AS10]|nr:type II toxin-antitoxin system RelE/ParE family toxin [Salsipaludibacter albus]
MADLRAARDHHDSARHGLGRRLDDALDEVFSRLEAFPRSAPLVAGYTDVRRAVVRGFPHVVFYRHRPDWIDVLRILHAARSHAEGSGLT